MCDANAANARRIEKMRHQRDRAFAVEAELHRHHRRAALFARMAELDAHPERAAGFEGITLVFHRWALKSSPSYAGAFAGGLFEPVEEMAGG